MTSSTSDKDGRYGGMGVAWEVLASALASGVDPGNLPRAVLARLEAVLPADASALLLLEPVTGSLVVEAVGPGIEGTAREIGLVSGAYLAEGATGRRPDVRVGGAWLDPGFPGGVG